MLKSENIPKLLRGEPYLVVDKNEHEVVFDFCLGNSYEEAGKIIKGIIKQKGFALKGLS